MNNSIKEILDMFTKYKDDWYSCEYKLKPKQCVILYDYITNLQKENENLLYEINGYLKEKEELKEKINKLEDYKSRNEKAIEFIKSKKAIINTDYIRIFDLFEIEEQGYTKDLLNILQGGDEE